MKKQSAAEKHIADAVEATRLNRVRKEKAAAMQKRWNADPKANPAVRREEK